MVMIILARNVKIGGEPCEFCDVCVPITCEFEPKEITVRQMTLCGIPIGHPQYDFER